MATVDDVDGFATGLPDVTVGTSYGNTAWQVHGHTFVWVRPFSKADLRRFGDEVPPAGPIVAVRVDDLAEKEAVLQAHAGTCFTIAHFDAFPAVLVNLPDVDVDELRQIVVDGWLACAPERLAGEYLAEHHCD